MAKVDGTQVEETWVRRGWCVWAAVVLVLMGAVSNAFYLWNHCPLGLSEDESHYWEWSRHLDYGYYSKPPGIAWVIAGAVKVGAILGLNGDGSGVALMPVVRMPAVVFAVLSGMLSLFLARRIFRDDRTSLAVTLLSAAVPMFVVGSLLITIDSPMYLCWAGTVCCLWRAVEAFWEDPARRTKWLYLGAVVCAVGMLFKPVLIALPACALIAALWDLEIERALKTWHALTAMVIVLLSQAPTLVWNSNHGWVTFKHIATQGGFQGGGDGGWTLGGALKHFGDFVGGQAGGMGGGMFVLLVVAVIVACRRVKADKARSGPLPLEVHHADPLPRRTGWVFLLSFTVPLWAFYFLMNAWKNTEVNWPAASYFTGMILTAGVVVEGWNAVQRGLRWRWRIGAGFGVGLGILLSAGAMNLQRLYPYCAEKLRPFEGPNRFKQEGDRVKDLYTSSIYFPGRWDLAAKKLRGFPERAAAVQEVIEQVRQETGMEPLVVTPRYDTSSSLAFYLPGHPFVYCMMSTTGGRRSQYDLWPDLSQRGSDGRLTFGGRPVVIVGVAADQELKVGKPSDATYHMKVIDAILKPAFQTLTGPEKVPVRVLGITLQEMTIYRGYGFRGLPPSYTLAY